MDKLVFFKNSADKLPGKGIHENVTDMKIYENLAKIKNWRRILCSLWDEENFIYDHLSFRSIDHALQYKNLA